MCVNCKAIEQEISQLMLRLKLMRHRIKCRDKDRKQYFADYYAVNRERKNQAAKERYLSRRVARDATKNTSGLGRPANS